MRTTRLLRSKTRHKRLIRRRNPFKRILQVTALLLVLLSAGTTAVLAGSVGGAYAVYRYFTRDLPDFTELEKLGRDVETTFETTKIYAWGADRDLDGHRDPVLIYEIIDPLGGDRQWIPLNQMPPDLVNATIAIEDKTFWENQGYDLEGIGRAFFEYVVRGGSVQGGSSITQQVVKNNLIAAERRIVGSEVGLDDYRRKVEELLLSARISNVYSKEQILEWYLNTNFYGNLAYGIEAAARVYFDKPAVELTLAEAAMLAAIPQSPAYNPINNPEQAKVRQELVLHAMYREGYIDRETLVAAKAESVEARATLAGRFDIISPHFALYARKELERRFGVERVVRGGLTVYTTLDLTVQEQAECVTRVQIARLSGKSEQDVLGADELARCEALVYLLPLTGWRRGFDHNVNNASVVMLDPRTGEIRAMVGSLNYWDDSINGRFNVAVDGLRQPGSSIKPLTYLTAISQGYTAAGMMIDVETDFGTPYNGIPYVPVNYDRKFHGLMSLRHALGNSYNVPAVQALSWVGVEAMVRMSHRMGLTTLEDAGNYSLPLALGAGEVKLLDMTYAYAVFANLGRMIGQPVLPEQQRFGYRTLDPVAILRVEDRNGNVIYDYNQPQYEQVITPQEAFIMVDVLSDNKARCEAFGCPNALELPEQRPAAVKTGTTNNFRDDWTIGVTPQLATGVWLGNTDNSEMIELPSYIGATPIWNALMTWALKDEPKIGWLPPFGVEQVEVCRLSGLLPSRDCPTYSEWFIAGTEPRLIDNLYQRFRINAASGRLATAATPPDLVVEKVFLVYPEEARDWARETGKPLPPQLFDPVGSADRLVGNAAILSPEPFSFVRGVVAVTGNARSAEFSRFTLSYFPSDKPNDLRTLVANNPNPANGWNLGSWNTTGLPDGPYTLLVQVFNQDGVIVEEGRSQVTVDNTPPTVRITSPFRNQLVYVEDESVAIQTAVNDGFSIERVSFYVDGAGVPFGITTVPPFTDKWNIPGPGCRTFRAEVRDAAGNSARSEPVSVCFIERETEG